MKLVFGISAILCGMVSHPVLNHYFPPATFVSFLVFGIGVVVSVYNPRRRRREKHDAHIHNLRTIINNKTQTQECCPKMITILNGDFPKNCEYADGVWKPKQPEVFDAVFCDGEMVVDWAHPIKGVEEKPGPVQIWQDFRIEVRNMVIAEVQNVMASGWPFDAQLSNLSPHDLMLAKRVMEAQIISGLSKAELGRRLGVSATTVSDWLNARRKIPTKHINSLKRHLKIESNESH